MKTETLAQARTWDKTKSLYVKDGLYHRCAAQAAYGHSHGFKGIKPPCATCKPIVDNFPIKKLGKWHAQPKGDRRNERDEAQGQTHGAEMLQSL